MTERWTWSYVDAAGAPLPEGGVTSAFPSQAEAEAYVGESWQDLAEAGVRAVTLHRDGEVVYGPMSLEGE